MLWQEKYARQKKPKPAILQTTPPLEYGERLRVAALNVQGFNETPKLQSCLIFMQEYHVDVMLLSETKSGQYYSYQSKQHLVILSGNNKDPNAGVGPIIAPHLRPHLADVIRVNPRISHLVFKKKGGNMHFIGVYGPHSGLNLEEFREPFWEQPNEHVSRVLQPELVFITGISMLDSRHSVTMTKESQVHLHMERGPGTCITHLIQIGSFVSSTCSP